MVQRGVPNYPGGGAGPSRGRGGSGGSDNRGPGGHHRHQTPGFGNGGFRNEASGSGEYQGRQGVGHRGGHSGRQQDSWRSNHSSHENDMDQEQAGPSGGSRGRRRFTSTSGATGGGAGNNGAEEKQKRSRQGPTFGFKRLFNFLSAGADEVINNIYESIGDWENLLNDASIAEQRTLRNGSSEFSDDMLILIVNILGEKVCSEVTVFNTKQNSILAVSANSPSLRKKIQDKCQNMLMNGPSVRTFHASNDHKVDRDPAKFFKNLDKTARFLARRLKQSAVDFLNVIYPITMGMFSYWSINGVEMTGELEAVLNEFKSLKEIKEALEKELERQKTEETRKRKLGVRDLTDEDVEILHNLEPPDNFREMSVVPGIEEILSKQEPFLRPNKTSGAYNSAEHYLDVQFRLLREDFVRPLKQGIQDYIMNKSAYLSKRKKQPIGSVRMYHGTQIKEMKELRGVHVQYIQLQPKFYQKIKWDRSKRLLNGSLLVFTPDEFKTAFFAVIHERDKDKLRHGILGVVWNNDFLPSELRQWDDFLMVESEVYFEAYRYTLQILKDIQLQDFRMAKFIIQVSTDVRPPPYLIATPELMKIGNRHISPLDDVTWPTAGKLEMDEKQLAAFKACMTKEFVIVQGPPGTGKTYLGLQVVETLLLNQSMWKDTPDEGMENSEVGPILIVCYTNHALDQFLEGILKVFTKLNQRPSMIRVGGMSKTEALGEFSLMRQRQLAITQQRLNPMYRRRKYEAHEAVREHEAIYGDLKNQIQGLSNPSGIVLFKNLTFYKQLEEEIPSKIFEDLSNPAFYGYAPNDFKGKTDRDLQALLPRWFNIRPFVAGPTPQPRAPNVRAPDPDEHDSEEEDYDVAELLEKRLLEEINDEIESTPAKAARDVIKLSVMFGKEIHAFRKKLNAMEHQLEALSTPENMVLDANRKHASEIRESIRKDKIELESLTSFQAFVALAMNLYKQKQLILPEIAIEYLRSGVNLINLPVGGRWSVYFFVLERAIAIGTTQLAQAYRSLAEARANLQEVIKYGDGKLLAQSLIVGMTTTGAAKYNDILRMAQARIVIVEEAAEVLEAHIVTCITPACQQLILIGDHQQLRPSTTVYELATKCSLDISLFERMVRNKLNCYKIDMQHRMRPEICDLVRGTIYKELRNAPNVYEYPRVPGVLKNLFFITHDKEESSDSDSRSKSNLYEAEFLASFCRYLVQQGYLPEQITILTTYTGQMFLIKQQIRDFVACKGVRVTCVDNFQGEENDIILLSLVRSNEDGNIGFLKTDNRICVALSRAKHGLYVMGNMAQLENKSNTWKKISKKLFDREEIGESVQIQCQIHLKISEIKEPAGFRNLAPEGGCLEMCKTKLKCDHVCRLVCHIPDRDHQKYRCVEPCQLSCCRGHPCKQKCFEECPACNVWVPKTLPCGHTTNVRCSRYDAPVQCLELVEKELPCKHKETLACWVDVKKYTCRVKVEKTLPCDHKKELECHIDATSVRCKVMKEKKLLCDHMQDVPCYYPIQDVKCDTDIEWKFDACDHKGKVKCHSKATPVCINPCTTRLDCGHACTKKCHVTDDPEHLDYKCSKDCARLCDDGHRCKDKHRCHQKCPDCKERTLKELPCGHKKHAPCHQKPENVVCNEPCSRTLGCAHICWKKCSEECGPCKVLVQKITPGCRHPRMVECEKICNPEDCDTLVDCSIRSACGHMVKIPCKLRHTIQAADCVQYCKAPCDFWIPGKEDGGCGHKCKGSCGDCHQGRMHVQCSEPCGRILACGHKCDSPCSLTCPPCTKKCDLMCDHNKCAAPCGQPCNGCSEPCTWICEHKRCDRLCSDPCNREPCNVPCRKQLQCGHECIGFCGEPCPSQCRICNQEELEEFILSGLEDEEDARFVFLEDCGHAIEFTAMEYYMNQDIEEGEIVAKCCPRCKTLIRKSRRYGNVIKARIADIMKVKQLQFGKPGEIKQLQTDLVNQVQLLRNRCGLDFLEFATYIWKGLVSEFSDKKKIMRYKEKKVPYNTLLSLNIMAQYLKEIVDDLPTIRTGMRSDPMKPEHRQKFTQLVNTVFLIMKTRALPFSSTEYKNFDLEFNRIHDMKQLLLLISSPRYAPGLGANILKKINAVLDSTRVYDKKAQEDVKTSLKELEKVAQTGLGITDRERQDILQAIGMAPGRWFKCPNGHIYIITDCGGAVTSGRCNECGASIGGASYRLNQGNTLAPEMDGATTSLWPGMARVP